MKKIVGVFAAATMMFALPSVAMAAQFNSPSGTTVTDQSGVSISVSGDVTSASGNGYIDVTLTHPAANVPAGVTRWPPSRSSPRATSSSPSSR